MADRIMMTGGRNFTNRPLVEVALGRAAGEFPGSTLVHGACPDGADYIASTVWAEWGHPVEPFPARWDLYRMRAGYVRNSEMVRLQPAPLVCIAFLAPCVKRTCKIQKIHISHGTKHCMKEAQSQGIEIWRYTDVPEFTEAADVPTLW